MPQAPKTDASAVRCPACGVDSPATVDACIACGHPFADADRVPVTESVPEPSTPKKHPNA